MLDAALPDDPQALKALIGNFSNWTFDNAGTTLATLDGTDFTIVANSAPTITAPSSATVNEDNTFTFNAGGADEISVGWVPVLLILMLASGRGIAWLCFNSSQQYIGASRAAIIFLSVSFFAVFFQLLVAWRAPGLGVQVPHDLGMALAGGLLVAAGIVVLQS